MNSRSQRARLVIWLFAAVLVMNSTVLAQSPSVTDTLVSRVLGESMLRGKLGSVASMAAEEFINSDVSMKHSESIVKEARAARERLATDLDRAENFWNKRMVGFARGRDFQTARADFQIIRRQEALRVATEISKTTEASRQLRQANTWNLLQNHPDLTRAAINEGRGLNFILYRLDTTMLAYTYALDQNSEAQQFIDQLRLSPEIIHGLNLKQSSGDGAITFPADGAGLDTSLWPYQLRGPRFAAAREAFESAKRATGLESQTGQVSFEAHDALHAAVAGLQEAFDRTYPADSVRKSASAFVRQYLETRRFLKNLDNEVYRLETTGKSHLETLQFDPKKEGDHLLALLGFMAKNQLVFAPASKGNEHYYQQVFQMMRDLYSTVNEEQ